MRGHEMGAELDTTEFMRKLASMRNLSPLGKKMAECCAILEKDIKESMRDTATQSTGYHTHNKKKLHYPSVPGNPPAVDAGTLRRSITFSVTEEESRITGRVGSTPMKHPYDFYLEFGTSRMAERPWLRPAMERNKEVIMEKLREAVGEIINGQR